MYVDDMLSWIVMMDLLPHKHGPMLQASNMVPYRLGQAEGIHGPQNSMVPEDSMDRG